VSQDRNSQPSDDVLIALNRTATAARLFAGAVHDANNSLMVILGTVEMMAARDVELPDSVRHGLDQIARHSGRAAAALTGVQAFTRPATTGRSRIDLRALVSQSVALRQFAVAKAGLRISLKEPAERACLVLADAGAIQQAILNLIINAEQAAAVSGGEIVVEVFGTENTVEVLVSDSGPGIAEQLNLFAPFTTTQEPRQGAGLGLWAARTLVERDGGRVDQRPAASGATFVLTLPRA
jgi:signal transduction histidine kinase